MQCTTSSRAYTVPRTASPSHCARCARSPGVSPCARRPAPRGSQLQRLRMQLTVELCCVGSGGVPQQGQQGPPHVEPAAADEDAIQCGHLVHRIQYCLPAQNQEEALEDSVSHDGWCLGPPGWAAGLLMPAALACSPGVVVGWGRWVDGLDSKQRHTKHNTGKQACHRTAQRSRHSTAGTAQRSRHSAAQHTAPHSLAPDLRHGGRGLGSKQQRRRPGHNWGGH